MKILILILILLTSCNKTEVKKIKQAKAINPIVRVKPFTELKWNNPKWDSYLISEIERIGLMNLKVKDSKSFFFTKNKTISWAKLLVEMAYWESKFDSNVSYKESFGLYSRGLFQVSKVDGKRYKCNFTSEKSVHNPKANIECAVKIMYKLVKQNKSIAGKLNGKWQGGARYWAVLRGSRKYTAKALKAIKQSNKE